jgi:hypothetical protein
VTVPGRRYAATVEVVYLGGTVPVDVSAPVITAVRAELAGEPFDLSFDVTPDPHGVLRVHARARGTNPVEILVRLAAALDRALLATGLFEEFDVSGKVLWVAPST